MKKLTYIFIVFAFKFAFGQEKCKIVHDTITNRDYYISTETAPKYPDGTELMMAYIKNKMVLPYHTFEINETIYLGFIVETNGKLTFLKMLKPFDNEELKNEIIRVVQNMPKWTPATCKNKTVPSLFVLPMKFKLK
jgi:hypothetical protein